MLNFAQGVASIDPAKPVGFARRSEPRIWQSKHQQFEANIVVLSTDSRCAVLIAVDALFVGSQLNSELIAACDGVDPSAIVIVASHTLRAGVGTTKPLLEEANAEHIAAVRERIVSEARAALTKNRTGLVWAISGIRSGTGRLSVVRKGISPHPSLLTSFQVLNRSAFASGPLRCLP
jgi:hypothetical protein